MQRRGQMDHLHRPRCTFRFFASSPGLIVYRYPERNHKFADFFQILSLLFYKFNAFFMIGSHFGHNSCL